MRAKVAGKSSEEWRRSALVTAVLAEETADDTEKSLQITHTGIWGNGSRGETIATPRDHMLFFTAVLAGRTLAVLAAIGAFALAAFFATGAFLTGLALLVLVAGSALAAIRHFW